MIIRNIFLKDTIGKLYMSFTFKNVPKRCRSLSLILPVAYCSAPPLKKIEITDPANLTHSFLLKQASCVTVNSVSQLLSHATLALIDTATQYKKALNDLMAMIEECQRNIGNESVQQELADIMISYRAKVNEYKSQFLELQSLFDYIEKIVESATETSFLVGAEYASTSLSEQLYSAKQEILKEKRSVEALEQEHLQLQKSFIDSSSDEKKKAS